MYKIVPFQIAAAGTATHLNVSCLPFNMSDKTASFYYELIEQKQVETEQGLSTTESRVLLQGNKVMPQEKYQEWGVDNMYCVNWLCAELGVQIDASVLI
ncbi:hypothetical protein [Nafulsella turpanensis]|uniref:hypothetical protein n=1 Tax=Nafulsella turpanensis TaxID=1265690 RepID=UPI000344FE04|nr:hypothetical protein [Nafulsella turpanensis]